MSRSIGDHALESVGVMAEPVVKTYGVEKGDEVSRVRPWFSVDTPTLIDGHRVSNPATYYPISLPPPSQTTTGSF